MYLMSAGTVRWATGHGLTSQLPGSTESNSSAAAPSGIEGLSSESISGGGEENKSMARDDGATFINISPFAHYKKKSIE